MAVPRVSWGNSWVESGVDSARILSRELPAGYPSAGWPDRSVQHRSSSCLYLILLFCAGLWPRPLGGTTLIPVSDRDLYGRAEIIVHGVVRASYAQEARSGLPETVTVIRPKEVWKRRLGGDLVLHDSGGKLPDGRFFHLWGRPEYRVGHEVIVFAIARPEGDFQTAELLLGKFEVERDEKGELLAVPGLAMRHAGVKMLNAPSEPATDPGSPRRLSAFLAFLRSGGSLSKPLIGQPTGSFGLSFIRKSHAVSSHCGPIPVECDGTTRPRPLGPSTGK